MKRALLALALLSCGTWQSTEPGPPPTQAMFEVSFALEEAVAGAEQDEALAHDAWVRAVTIFEREVEPALRLRHSPQVVASVEYRFSVIRAALSDPVAARREAEVLEAELRRLLSAP